MSGPRILRREISFYSIQTVAGSGKRAERDSTFDWPGFIAGATADPSRLDVAREALAPLRFDALDELALPALAVYRPIGTNMFVKSAPGSRTVEDLELEKGFELLNASAFFFLPTLPGLVCMLQGDPAAGSPPINSLRDFARAAVPQPAKVRWAVEPIHVGSQIEELRRAETVAQMKLKHRASPDDLLGSDGSGAFAEWAGFGQVASYFARSLGSEVEVALSVTVPREWRTRGRGQRFRDLIAEHAGPRVLETGKVTARAMTRRDGTVSEETLTLAQHDLASKIEVEVHEGEAVRFSKLVEETARDLVENAQRYAALALGGSYGEQATPKDR